MTPPPKAALAPIRSHTELTAAIQALHSSLRVIACGIEPDLGRHLREIARIAEFGEYGAYSTLPLYCRELETRLWELACCEIPASVEDYDVFVQLLQRIELAAREGSSGSAPDESGPFAAPRELLEPSRRLRTRPTESGFQLSIPETTSADELDRLLEDLTVLWEITPRSSAWLVDCSRLRRVPLALLAHLIDLRLQDGDHPRAMRMSGIEHHARSSELNALLREHFSAPAR